MKSVVFILALFATIYCQGQHISESEDSPEIEEIILNYRDNKIEHFEIRTNNIYQGKIEKIGQRSYYLILEDTFLVEKFRKRGTKGHKYVIRKNGFFYLSNDSIIEKAATNENSEGPFPYRIEYDSANVHYIKSYMRNITDSILTYERKITKDSIGRVLEDISKVISNPNWGNFKRVKMKEEFWKYWYVEDTVFIEMSELKGNVWIPPTYWTSYIAKTSTTETDTSTEEITTINTKFAYYNSGSINEFTYRTVRKIVFDHKRVIQSIIYGTQTLNHDNNWCFDEAKIFTVRRTKK